MTHGTPDHDGTEPDTGDHGGADLDTAVEVEFTPTEDDFRRTFRTFWPPANLVRVCVVLVAIAVAGLVAARFSVTDPFHRGVLAGVAVLTVAALAGLLVSAWQAPARAWRALPPERRTRVRFTPSGVEETTDGTMHAEPWVAVEPLRLGGGLLMFRARGGFFAWVPAAAMDPRDVERVRAWASAGSAPTDRGSAGRARPSALPVLAVAAVAFVGVALAGPLVGAGADGATADGPPTGSDDRACALLTDEEIRSATGMAVQDRWSPPLDPPDPQASGCVWSLGGNTLLTADVRPGGPAVYATALTALSGSPTTPLPDGLDGVLIRSADLPTALLRTADSVVSVGLLNAAGTRDDVLVPLARVAASRAG